MFKLMDRKNNHIFTAKIIAYLDQCIFVIIILGDYVMVEPIGEGDKVKAEIVSILYKEQIKYIKEEGLW